MKIEYLRKIMARIQSQIHCPKCKSPFAENQIEIRTVKGNQVEFVAQCEACAARSQISAEIGGGQKKPASRITKPQVGRPVTVADLPKTPLNQPQVEGLKSTLQQFSGQNVIDLFR